jgi:uncharacterized protein YbjT (DUF2867 family)
MASLSDGWLEGEEGHYRVSFRGWSAASIAGEDQGRVIAALLQNPEPHAGKAYPLYGPIELNHHEIAEKLTKRLGRPFVYKPITLPEFRERTEKDGRIPRLHLEGEVMRLTPSKTKPQGIALVKWTMFNQNGEEVYTFTPITIVPRREG